MSFDRSYNSFQQKANKLNELFGDTTTKKINSKKLEVVPIVENKVEMPDTLPVKSFKKIDILDNVEEKTDVLSVKEIKRFTNKTIGQDVSFTNAPEIGAVMGINRGFYEHYGIYVGNNRVIHYTSIDSDVSLNNIIEETDMSHFMRGETEFFVIDFNKMNQGMKGAEVVDELFEFIFGLDTTKIDGLQYNLLSPEETVQRARTRIGEGGYDLVTNNCEHFAMWCKTGVSECNQLLTRKYRRMYKYPFTKILNP